MNKKQMIIAALVTVLSVSAAHATSTITGVTNGGSGTFNINPEKINGQVGYRQYADFNLGEGDIANLIYQGRKNGELRDLSTFINLVNNKINIEGVLNAVKANGAGHAVFISPKGLTVGPTGVVNVGTLSVLTPTQAKYNSLSAEYAVDNFANINQINKMRNNTAVNGNNYGGNAPVEINGYVFTRNGADIRGSQVDVAGGIVNGYAKNNNFTAGNFDGQTTAEALFNTLVNTNGIPATSSNLIVTKGNNVVIKSGAGVDNYINVTGKVVNLDNGETVLTNHGDKGLTLSDAVIAGNGKVNVYNNNATGALDIKNAALVNAAKDSLSVTSKGGINFAPNANLKAAKNVEVVNKGNALNLAGDINAGDKVDVVNSGLSGMNINGNIGATTKPNTVRIVNENGKLTFIGNAYAKESVSLRNKETANGMQVDGTINAGQGVLVHNEKGNLTLNGTINATQAKVENGVENVAIAVYNEGNGSLTTGTASQITSDDGNIAIKNAGANGMELKGTITNKDGETAINNTAGAMTVKGTINNNGNMGIINRGTGAMTMNAKVDNTGKLKVANVNGEDFTVENKITNKNGNVSLFNYNGDFEINGEVSNDNGYLFVYSRDKSNGLTTGANSKLTANNGDLAIKHNGTGSNAMNRGLDLNGTVTKTGTKGELAINNYNDDMHVGGTIKTNTKTGIIARNGSDDLTVDAKVVSTNNQTFNIKNEKNTGDMTVKGDITHNGRLNILNNSGTLTLDGKITNNGSNRTYAIVRDPNGGNTQRDGGVVVGQNFNAQSTDGMIYVLNKVGQDGMTYKGSAVSTNGQVEIYNKAGDMTVNGGTLTGNPTVILNTGAKMTVTEQATVSGKDIKIVNKGTEAATVADKHKGYFKEKVAK